jgi:hypothetical protein
VGAVMAATPAVRPSKALCRALITIMSVTNTIAVRALLGRPR